MEATRKRSVSRLLLAALTVAAVTAALIGVAAAHTKKWPTSTTAQLGAANTEVSGKISSPKAKCEKGRSVELVSADGSDTLDLVYSKAGGAWTAEIHSPEPGQVRVEVWKEFFPFKPGHRHICKKAATTVTIPAEPPEPEFRSGLP